jgi:aspartyl-tRNA(Asn)/glutamyl-tRNA(Gln) amidotransferase subunit A
MNEPKPLWSLGVLESAAAYANRSATPVEVLESTLSRAAELEPKLNVFAHLDSDGATKAAQASAARWDAGAPLGPLDGVVLSIKDNITVKGLRCAWGSELFQDSVSQTDEIAVERLRAAGAVILGKTNVSEFTVGRSNVSTKCFGTTRNPWNPAMSTGASSGGAAASVAAGIGAAALGTDGGGSIRRPAAHCGLVGLKPSTGRVARYGGLPAILHDCEVVGPLARSVLDLRRVFEVIAGSDPRDRLSWAFDKSSSSAFADMPASVRDRPPPKKALKIRYVDRFGSHEVDPAVLQSCRETVGRLKHMGHDVEEGVVPFDIALHERHWPILVQTGIASIVRSREWRGRIAPHLETMVEKGQALTALDYFDALAAFRELQMQLGQFFSRYDILVTPTAGACGWPADENGPSGERVFTGFANAAGVPALSLPSVPDANGMPIGVQLVSGFGRDDLLLDLAADIEARRPWKALAPV